MTDRELLEAAAKAAGLTHLYCEPWQGMAKYNKHLDEFYGPIWNPLTDDGDALRLAVRLGFDVRPSALDGASECGGCYETHHHGDIQSKEEATRRAIVRAAAAMGAA